MNECDKDAGEAIVKREDVPPESSGDEFNEYDDNPWRRRPTTQGQPPRSPSFFDR